MDVNEKLNQALNLISSEQFVEAEKILLPLAEHGSSKAQARLGFLYLAGLEMGRDIELAEKWLLHAAHAGEGDAAHNLGTLYRTSAPDIPIDLEKSKEYFRLAKQLGFKVAPDEFYDE